MGKHNFSSLLKLFFLQCDDRNPWAKNSLYVCTDFHGLDPDLLSKALQILVKRGKAQIFGQEDSQGVKFF